MTRMIRLRFRRLVIVAAASTGAVALALGTAAAASAGVTPTPTPTPAVTSPAPSPSPLSLRLLRPEAFIVHADSSTLPDGTVFATGPVRGTGTDPAWTPGTTRDTFDLTGPTGTVRVLHSRIGTPVVDPAACVATLDQTGRWALFGRSGADRFAFGFGTFRLAYRAILARTRSGRCLPDITRWVDLDVLGTGQAVNFHRVFIAPRLGPALTPVS
jgi:hypothetical protein